VEVGFVTNKWEEKLLKSIAYRQKITDALTDAVLTYNQEYEKTNGFSQ
jgi:N-acetylmuramoyl-L-alanine amidase